MDSVTLEFANDIRCLAFLNLIELKRFLTMYPRQAHCLKEKKRYFLVPFKQSLLLCLKIQATKMA